MATITNTFIFKPPISHHPKQLLYSHRSSLRFLTKFKTPSGANSRRLVPKATAAPGAKKTEKPHERVQRVHSVEEFESALESAKDRLVVVEYAASDSEESSQIYPFMVELSRSCNDVEFILVMGDESEKTKELLKREKVENVPHFSFYKSKEKIHEEEGIGPDMLVGDVLYYGDNHSGVVQLHNVEDVKMSSFAGDCEQPGHPGDITQKEADAGILPSHGISLDIPGELVDGRPPMVQYLSAPSYQSPLRHHRRSASVHREVKETLDARSEYMNNEQDGRAEHHINQYVIKDEIGRGSFGAVHLAVDQYGSEFAVKEFSKSRLRKRARSNILRRPHYVRRPGHLAAGGGLNSPLHRHSASDIRIGEQQGNPLYLIKEEIAIMKKLNHPNLVSLIEVLDDPEEDSLYMVLEMCKKGVVMKVGLGEKADPYDIESCRCWFRDLILGIEYLHAQGVVHRDIKPDNLLLTEDDVLKVVDFGVSEMFEKASDMMTAKSTGSPAFLPPELCITKHGDVSGRAADIWSMGVSLYCLRFGHIPFEKTGVLELYEAIKNDELEYEPNIDPQFVDLMRKLLEKDPKKRITMDDIREHPWVTNNGSDPLLSKEDNIATLVEPPSETEVNHAITTKMRGLLVVMKAVKKFKAKLEQRRPNAISETLGKGIRVLHPSLGMDEQKESVLQRSKSSDLEDRRMIEGALAAEGVHHDGTYPSADGTRTIASRMDSSNTIVADEEPIGKIYSHQKIEKSDSSDSITNRPGLREQHSGDKGHAHDPLDEQPLYLGIGAGVNEDGSLDAPPEELIAESPTAAEFSIYDTAYQQEVDRIRAAKGQATTVYLTRRVDHKKEYKADRYMINLPNHAEMKGRIQEGWKGLVDRAQESKNELSLHEKLTEGHQAFSDLVSKAVENTKNMGRDISERGGTTFESVVHGAMEKRKEKVEEEQKDKGEKS